VQQVLCAFQPRRQFERFIIFKRYITREFEKDKVVFVFNSMLGDVEFLQLDNDVFITPGLIKNDVSTASIAQVPG
jgi:hypothetical protein